MKKLLSIIFLSGAFALSSQAQFVNGGFENWTAGEPDGYMSFNSLVTIFGGPATVTQTTDKRSGNSALKMEVIAYTQKFTNKVDTIGAYLVSNNPDTADSKHKINYIPSGLKGYFKFNSPKPYKAAFAIIFYNKDVNVGVLGYEFSTNTNAYTEFVCQYSKVTDQVPDSYQVVIILGDKNNGPLVQGSYLLLDDLEFTGKPAGTDIATASAKLKVYPIPATTSLTIDNMDVNATSIVIKSIDGKTVQTRNIATNSNILNVDAMSSGIYFFEISDNQNQLLQRGKFSVAK